MFQKLHRQMALFCTLIVSLLLVSLTLICLLISERSLRANAEASFLRVLNTALVNLQTQDAVSLQWRMRLQADSGLILRLYDNGIPLYSQRLNPHTAHDALAERARSYAEETFQMNLASTAFRSISTHEEFLLSEGDVTYYVSAGVIPKGGGSLGFIILSPQTELIRQIHTQRLIFAALDAAALLFLSLFIWHFTGKMLLPLAENHQKQLDFISAASHELRTPLAVMLSGTDALERAHTDAERAHFLSILRTEGTRMQRLISDLLFLARSGSGSFSIAPESCPPELLLLNAYEAFELSAHQKRQSISLSLPEGSLPPIHCDPERIAQVFAILLDNAISYTPEGGCISLSLKRRGTAVCFCVTDSGPGIPDAKKDLIFDRFYRADGSHADRQHFGLGLCIAREIVTAHHGKLWVTDAPEGGACFFVSLPTD